SRRVWHHVVVVDEDVLHRRACSREVDVDGRAIIDAVAIDIDVTVDLPSIVETVAVGVSDRARARKAARWFGATRPIDAPADSIGAGVADGAGVAVVARRADGAAIRVVRDVMRRISGDLGVVAARYEHRDSQRNVAHPLP